MTASLKEAILIIFQTTLTLSLAATLIVGAIAGIVYAFSLVKR
jgi:hypothetical protein